MNRNIQLVCVWSGPLFLMLYGMAFVVVSRFLPPPSPSWSAARIAEMFAQHRTSIRIGQILGLYTSILLFPFFAIISVQIARIEKRFPVLAVIQFGAATLLVVFFQLDSMLWITATFRPELDATTVRLLNDLCWLIFAMVAPGMVLQMVCLAIAVFRDTSEQPMFPRWTGYVCLWFALVNPGGVAAVFFKAGPFAWNGLFGIYLPLVGLFIWVAVMAYCMHVWISRQPDAGDTTA